MRVPIRFIDHSGNQTADYLKGWPVVPVQIEIGFTPPADPNQLVVPEFKQHLALVDTGSDHTIVDPSLVVGLTPLRETNATNVGIMRRATVHRALILVGNFGQPIHLEIGSSSLEGSATKMILGRDIITRFKLVMDGLLNEFYLEG